jgi:hypothetical protein
MRLRPIHNKRLGQWNICHNQWCEKGETSIVATVLASLNDEKDEMWARLICDRFNEAVEVRERVGKLHSCNCESCENKHSQIVQDARVETCICIKGAGK